MSVALRTMFNSAVDFGKDGVRSQPRLIPLLPQPFDLVGGDEVERCQLKAHLRSAERVDPAGGDIKGIAAQRVHDVIAHSNLHPFSIAISSPHTSRISPYRMSNAFDAFMVVLYQSEFGCQGLFFSHSPQTEWGNGIFLSSLNVEPQCPQNLSDIASAIETIPSTKLKVLRTLSISRSSRFSV